MSEPQTKRKKPNYYIKKKRRQYILEPGLKGFLCTCNFHEKECIREAYNILNTYADQLDSNTNDETEDKDKNEQDTKEENSDSDDITETLSKEINQFLSEKSSKKRLQVVESGAKNILFIRTTIENPIGIVSAIIKDILTTKQQKCRYLLRLLPIEMTCKANMNDIKQCVSTLIQEHFLEEPKTFSVAFNHRNNQQISRDEILKEIPVLVTGRNSNHKVDLKNPDLTIIIEVMRGMCLLSIIPFYYKYKKYNLIQLFESATKNTESTVSVEKIDNNTDTKVKTDDNNE